MTSKYPNELDSSAELPMVVDNVTEIGADLLNSMREAIFAIEQAIGINPQGATASLVNRLSQSINDNGTFKASALVAAGLIALPITNSMIGATAGIQESKLDLDIATKTLQSEIESSRIDIIAIQQAIIDIINNFTRHVDGLAFQHDSFAILLDVLFPSSTPPEFVGLSGTTVGAALIEINNNLRSHISSGTSNAHNASNISLTKTLSFPATNVEEAIEGLDTGLESKLILHRDDQHANGFTNWANTLDGYNTTLQLIPSTLGTFNNSLIISGSRSIIDFITVQPASSNVHQGDVVLVANTSATGFYQIDDVGPRNPLGTKPALSSTQVEIVGVFPTDGYVNAQIFGAPSVQQFKTNLAPTIHQSDIRVDSVQVARPNSAKVLSLGINPSFINNTSTIAVEVGVGPGLFRTLTVNRLDFDRSGSPASPITITSIVERINSIFQNRVDGNAFPAAAYRVGDELMLAHNWNDSSDYSIRILSTGTANFALGFDGYGADVLDKFVRPSIDASYYVAGNKLTDVKRILTDTVSIAGQVFTFATKNPLQSGVKVGHLVHLKTHPTDTSARGTYFIIGVSSNSVTVHKNAGVTAAASASVEILFDALPLDDFDSNVRNCVIDTFVDFNGRLGYNLRLDHSTSISNLKVVDVSDNYAPKSVSIVSSVSGSTLSLHVSSGGTDGSILRLPTSTSGQFKLNDPSGIENVTVALTSPVGIGTDSVQIYQQVSEEDVLEICTVRFDGITTLSNIVDKRLFGNVGLDEVREDYTQANIETPLSETRSGGCVVGFDILQDNYQDLSVFASNVFGTLIAGGTAYVGGVRLDIPTTPVMFPSVAGTYYIALNATGTYNIINNTSYTLEQIWDGYAGTYLPIAKVVHTGGLSNPLTSTDLRFFINNLDDKVELLLDATNRRIGNLASVDAAVDFINNYPHSEKFKVRVVSFTSDNIIIPSGSRPFTLEIDGTVGSITANSSCRITSSTPLDRTTPHILGSLTASASCTEITVEGIKINGTSTISATGRARFVNSTLNSSISISTPSAKIANCIFTSTCNSISITSTDASITNCSFLSGCAAITSSSNYITVSGCRFANLAPINITGAGKAIFNSCVFDGGAGNGQIVVALDNYFTDCLFYNYNQTSSDLISIGASANNITHISNCIFDTVVLTAAFAAIKAGVGAACRIDSCTFNTFTFTSNPFVICSGFTNNILVGTITNNAFIKLLGNSIFSGNSGFHSVAANGGASDTITISNNSFPASTLGYNVDLTKLGSTQAVVSGNRFLAISDDGILVGGNAAECIISNNAFNGANAINFSSSVQLCTIVGNLFSTSTMFVSSASISRSNIENNVFFISGTTSTLQVGNRVRIAGNLFETGTSGAITLTGVSASRFAFADNITSSGITININVPCSFFDITGNVLGTLSVGANLDDGTLSDNVISNLTGGGSFTLSQINFSSNILNGSVTNHDLLEWDSCLVNSNMYSLSAPITFKLGNINTISGNNFTNNLLVSVKSSGGGTINNLSFCGNTGSGYSFLALNSLSEAEINDNNNISRVVFPSGISDSSVCGNISIDGYMEFDGAADNVNVSSNELDHIYFFTTNANHSVTNCSFQNNILVTEFSVGRSINSGKSCSFNNSIISGNAVGVGGINLFAQNITPTGATLSLTNIVINGNMSPAGGVLMLNPGDGSFNYSGLTIDNISITANTLLTVEVLSSVGGGHTVALSSFVITGNQIATGIFLETLTLNNSIISENEITTQLFLSGVASSNTVISNNYIASGMIITLTSAVNPTCSNMKIADNTFGSDVSISTTSHTIYMYMEHNHFAAGLDMSGVAVFDRLVFAGNTVVGILTWPDAAAFTGGTGQSKWFFNYAGTWATSGVLTLSGASNFIFPWGNTGGGVSGVSITGNNATASSSANNLSGGINV